jgi:hypothetical protein
LVTKPHIEKFAGFSFDRPVANPFGGRNAIPCVEEAVVMPAGLTAAVA